jgi:endonuclease/exonuclease/phosphatase family metal-dependent hydrolase
MTYNTHSCVGTDGKTSPRRIADIIMEYAPDIVALQELDMGLSRTDSVDQAQFIADQIRMDYHFHPTLFIEEGQYGNAILTHFPMRVVRACHLPGLPRRTQLEKRGALWVEIMIGDRPVQVVVVHMGLNRAERLAQAMELAGSDWLASPQCQGPSILCGDLNSFPGSRVHRLLKTCMRDALSCAGNIGATWPGRFPVARLDYIYVSEDVSILDCSVLRSPLIRRASDHLPLMARLRIAPEDKPV